MYLNSDLMCFFLICMKTQEKHHDKLVNIVNIAGSDETPRRNSRILQNPRRLFNFPLQKKLTAPYNISTREHL